MLIGLIGQGLSEQEIRSFIPVGGYKMARLRNEIKDPSVREKRLTKKIGPHAFTDADIQNLCDFVQSLEAADKFEDGFPCSHHRIKKYFKVYGLDWKKVWAEYVKVMQAKIPPAREMSYQRWLQYVHALYPQIWLARSKEDECDACVALKIELSDPDLTPESREELEAVKQTHIDEAVIQRRAVSALNNLWTGMTHIKFCQTKSCQTTLDDDMPCLESDYDQSNSETKTG